jgi:hypothetical protein
VTFTGRIRDSASVVERFQQDPGCLFFIGNIRAAGINITLAAASQVVLPSWTGRLLRTSKRRIERIASAKRKKLTSRTSSSMMFCQPTRRFISC